MRQVIPCKRIALSVVGLEVPHAHIHLIPINTMDDVRFQKKVNISDSEMGNFKFNSTKLQTLINLRFV